MFKKKNYLRRCKNTCLLLCRKNWRTIFCCWKKTWRATGISQKII